ncbi:MAG: indole-3-glycerol-phosphate synthase TrpC, partial [Polynucleobacter sp.]|nr:indole-3-glycerol-phosphate synthase TrpC [Polynucleobacter sp.]
MSDILTTIVATKRQEVFTAQALVTLAQLRSLVERQQSNADFQPRGFTQAIERTILTGGSAVIAEIKIADKGLSTLFF